LELINYDLFILPLIFFLNIYIYIFIYVKYYFNKLFLLNKKIKKYSLNFIKVIYNISNFYLNIHLFLNIYLYYILILFQNLWIINYFFNLENTNLCNNLNLNSVSYIYFFQIFFFLIFTFVFFKKNIFSQKNIESLSSYFIYFILLLYYLIVNNLLLLLFIFEFQSLIIIYLISNIFYLKNNSYLNFTKINKQSIWYFNSIIYQFWSAFFTAMLLVISILLIFKNFFFIDWINLEIYIYMLNLNQFNLNLIENLIFFSPFVFSLLFKLGLVPFFFWKPEIYKNLTLEILFLYITFYIFSIIFLVLFIFFNYFMLIQHFFLIYYTPITVISLTILPFLLYIIIEVRVFLSYTSIFHILLILSSLLFKKELMNFSFLYLYSYLLFNLIFITLLFYINNYSLWYFSDFQWFYLSDTVKIALHQIFLSMAGFPPYFGFFIKVTLLANLALDNNWYLFYFFLFFGFFIGFFYLQNFKFFGLILTKRVFFKRLLIIIFNINYIFTLISFFIINNLSIVLLNFWVSISFSFF
jgi:NADH:ubiquinone oxidoreductase subunit 2 (subunit N)